MKLFLATLVFIAGTDSFAIFNGPAVDSVCVDSLVRQDKVDREVAASACLTGLQVNQSCVDSKFLSGMKPNDAVAQCQIEASGSSLKQTPVHQEIIDHGDKLEIIVYGASVDAIAFIATMAAVELQKRCEAGGPILSKDKAVHLLGTFGVTFSMTALTGNVTLGAASGALVDGVREWYKNSHGAHCEYHSMLPDAVGLFGGTFAAIHFVIEKGGAKAVFQKAFD